MFLCRSFSGRYKGSGLSELTDSPACETEKQDCWGCFCHESLYLAKNANNEREAQIIVNMKYQFVLFPYYYYYYYYY